MTIDRSIPILVADDFKSMRSLIKTILRKLGFVRIYEANDGVEAWNFLKTDQVELIISDWNMPNMQGIELLRQVRADEKLKHLPFLMVTAEGQKENVIEAVKAGVSGYIVKPFSPVALEDKIQKIFAKK